MNLQLNEFDEEDRGLLEAAAAWPRDVDPADLRGDWPSTLARQRGIDFATAALFVHVRSRDGKGDANDTWSGGWRHGDAASLQEVTVAVAPGAFYREHPWTEADGAAIRTAASELGCTTELIPTASIGTLRNNAESIISWLGERAGERIVLVSLSKGGADVKTALARAARRGGVPIGHRLDQYRRHDRWLADGGVAAGPILGDAYLSLSVLEARGGTFSSFATWIAIWAGRWTLKSSCRLTCAVHIAGFPLQRHLRGKRAAAWHKRLAAWGPNDGAAILADVCRLPGSVVAVWGADHFSKDRLDLPALVAKSLKAIIASDVPMDDAAACVDELIERRSHPVAGAP